MDYLGYPIFPFEFHVRLEVEPQRNAEIVGELHFTQSFVRRSAPTLDQAIVTRQWSAADRAALRDFFDGRKGAALPFWLRSGRADYVLDDIAVDGATGLSVRDDGQLPRVSVVTRHLWIPDAGASGSAYRAAGWTGGGGSLAVDLAPALALAAPTDTLPIGTEIQDLYFVRFDGDELAMRAFAAQEATEAELGCVELQTETPTE